MTRLHYHLGRILGKRYRLWYHRTHKNQWLWGANCFYLDVDFSRPFGYDNGKHPCMGIVVEGCWYETYMDDLGCKIGIIDLSQIPPNKQPKPEDIQNADVDPTVFNKPEKCT